MNALAALFVSSRQRYLAEARRAHRETRHARKRRFLKQHIPPDGAGAEIGVFWGHFAQMALKTFRPRVLHLVDPWDRLHGDRFNFTSAYTLDGDLRPFEAERWVRRFALRHPFRVRVHKLYSHEFFSRLPDESLDWVYVDASHIYENVLKDLAAAFPKVKHDGIILGDDANPNPTRKDNGVWRAASEFAATRGLELTALDHYQFALKRGSSPQTDS